MQCVCHQTLAFGRHDDTEAGPSCLAWLVFLLFLFCFADCHSVTRMVFLVVGPQPDISLIAIGSQRQLLSAIEKMCMLGIPD